MNRYAFHSDTTIAVSLLTLQESLFLEEGAYDDDDDEDVILVKRKCYICGRCHRTRVTYNLVEPQHVYRNMVYQSRSTSHILRHRGICDAGIDVNIHSTERD